MKSEHEMKKGRPHKCVLECSLRLIYINKNWLTFGYTNQMFINRKKDKPIVVYLYNGILLSNKEE